MKPDWTVRTADGVELGAKITEPPGSALCDVVLLPAMMVDVRSLDRPPGAGLASVLARAGFRVHRVDFRGRGMSPFEGDWSYDDLVYRDLPAITGALERPWVVGHSLGGHVTAASWATGSIEIRGLVGLGANVWMPSLERSRRRRLRKAANMFALRTALRLFGRIPARRIGMGPVDEAHGYGADLLGFWRNDFWGDRWGRNWLGELHRIPGPMLSVSSDGDALLAHPAGARAWAERVRNVEIWQIADGDHGLSPAPGHIELGADGRCAPLWEAIAEWMRARG